MTKKPLHISNSFRELKKLCDADVNDITSIDMEYNLLKKLYIKHEQAFEECDEELAYIFAIRFLDRLKKVCELNKNESNFRKNFKVKEALDRAESLNCSLTKRYDDLCISNDFKRKHRENGMEDIEAKCANLEKENERLSSECFNLTEAKEFLDNKILAQEQEIIVKTRQIERFEIELQMLGNKNKEQDGNLKAKQRAIETMKTKMKENSPNESIEVKYLQRQLDMNEEEKAQMALKLENYWENLEQKHVENELLKKEIGKVMAELDNIKQLKFKIEVPDEQLQEDDNNFEFPSFWRKYMEP